MKKNIYPSLKVLALLTLAASTYIVLHGRFNETFRAITSSSFYLAVGISFLIGMMVTFLVHFITIWLDHRLTWETMPIERALLQVVLGIMVPLVLDVSLISVYFQYLRQDIFQNGFFLIDFPVILGFVIFLNVTYFIIYVLKSNDKAMILKNSTSSFVLYNSFNDEVDSEDYTDRINDEAFTEEELTKIILIQRVGKKVLMFTGDGKQANINHTISTFTASYSQIGFLQINRGTVIKNGITADYIEGLRRDNLQLIPKDEYNWILDFIRLDQLQVTKDFIPGFLVDFQLSRES